ncbi:MAG TPA: DUF481 domain-containing protein [Kiritimatiellia bacterium]|nr:DUF481 domain-containing protein [Kiritimatiellia bacterium]
MKFSKISVCSCAVVLAFGLTISHAEEKPGKWESSLALGLTLNDGNTDNSMFNASYLLGYTTEAGNPLRLNADLAYGETDNDKTTDNYKVELDYKHLISERAYGSLNASYFSDDISDLDYRWIVSPGVGYFLMKQENVTLTAEIGPALIGEKKGGETEENVALRIAERYERKMDSSARFWQALEYIPNIDDFEVYILNAEIGVEAPVSEKLNIRLVVKNTYDSDPAPDRKNNDVTVIGALAYSIF